MEAKPPLPPFTLETAVQKVRIAQDAWNSRDPARVIQAFAEDTRWRNRCKRWPDDHPGLNALGLASTGAP